MTVRGCIWFAFIWLCHIGGGDSRLFGFATPITYSSPKNFQVYWNVPTFMCHKHGMNFEQVSKNFGIHQNDKDKFRGDKMVILYDPGDFPALLKDDKENIIRRNGGVPQEGNLTVHLDYFRRQLSEQIPDPDFSGLGVIDFESWRPIFRQNWASLQIYRDFSIELEQRRHPLWNRKALQKEAVRRFEKYGKLFMQKSLEAARKLRPKAQWGYYAYPYCFNLTPNQRTSQCDPRTVIENDEMSWLFSSSHLLLPSVYLHQKLTPNQRVGLVRGRVQEAVRLAKKSLNNPKVFAYYWYKYQDQQNNFVDKIDLVNTIEEIRKIGADGIIVWGSSQDLVNRTKCEAFESYFNQTLGPILQRYDRLQQQLH